MRSNHMCHKNIGCSCRMASGAVRQLLACAALSQLSVFDDSQPFLMCCSDNEGFSNVWLRLHCIDKLCLVYGLCMPLRASLEPIMHGFNKGHPLELVFGGGQKHLHACKYINPTQQCSQKILHAAVTHPCGIDRCELPQ